MSTVPGKTQSIIVMDDPPMRPMRDHVVQALNQFETLTRMQREARQFDRIEPVPKIKGAREKVRKLAKGLRP